MLDTPTAALSHTDATARARAASREEVLKSDTVSEGTDVIGHAKATAVSAKRRTGTCAVSVSRSKAQ